MTYKELLQQLQQLSEEQLNQDVCIYDSDYQEYYQESVEIVYSTQECDTLDLEHPIIRFWWLKLPATHWTELSSQKTRKLASLSFFNKLQIVGIQVPMSLGMIRLTQSSASITTATSKKLNLSKLSETIMVLHFYEGQSYSWEYSNRSYDDSGCWEDYLSGDEYEEALDRKRFEQSNRGW